MMTQAKVNKLATVLYTGADAIKPRWHRFTLSAKGKWRHKTWRMLCWELRRIDIHEVCVWAGKKWREDTCFHLLPQLWSSCPGKITAGRQKLRQSCRKKQRSEVKSIQPQKIKQQKRQDQLISFKGFSVLEVGRALTAPLICLLISTCQHSPRLVKLLHDSNWIFSTSYQQQSCSSDSLFKTRAYPAPHEAGRASTGWRCPGRGQQRPPGPHRSVESDAAGPPRHSRPTPSIQPNLMTEERSGQDLN